MKCVRCFYSDQSVRDETCRHCSRNFTRIELLEVIALGLAHLFVCRFSFYLFTGDFFSKPLKGGVFFPVDFREIFTFPVNFGEHPVHILTVGWLFALVILLPLLVGLFYGATAGIVVAFVGAWHVVAPFFVLLMMLGALIAGTRVRNLLHLEAAVFVAAAPALVYLFSLSLSGVLGEVGFVAWLPWLVTVFFVAATVPPVMWYARRHDYKSTFLLPLTGVQTLLIIMLFYGTIGFSKVEYEFVRRDYWAGSPRFRITLDRNVRDSEAERREQALEQFEAQRLRAIGEFTHFIDWFPRSLETPMALFERAELHNMRSYFLGTRPNQLHPYTDRVSLRAVDEDYRRVLDVFGESLPAVDVRLKRARYYMQHTILGPSRTFLRDLVDLYELLVGHYRPSTDQPLGHLWREHRLDRDQRLRLMYEVLREARADLALLENNSDYNDLPLMLFCQLDPHDPGYADGLRQILKWFPDSKLADNVKLTLIERGPYTTETIETLLARYPNGDVAARLLLKLGRMYQQRKQDDLARKRLERLVKTFPDAPEGRTARDLLAEMLEPSGKEDAGS